MIKLKKDIATRYRIEQEQATTSGYGLRNLIATRRSNVSREDANKNKQQEPDVVNDYTTYKTTIDNLQSQKYYFQKELFEQRKDNANLTSRLELKEIEITELKQSINNLQHNLNKFKEKNNNMTRLSKISKKQIMRLNKEKENFQRKNILLQSYVRKLKARNEKNDKLLQKARQMCKQDFNSKIHPNFVQANSNLITDIVKLYDSCYHGDKIQHCPAIQYVNSVPEPIISPGYIEDIVSNNSQPPKKRKMDNLIKDIDKHYSRNSLKVLVMNLEQRHSEVYYLWRNVLWSLNKYGCARGYDTLEIADCFSKSSWKYKNLHDVKRTFDSSDGSLSLQYLIEISKIYEEELDLLAEYLTGILPPRYLPLTINRVDIRDRRKFRLNVSSANESYTLFIIPDLCVLTDEDGERLSFLQKKITSKNSELASLCSEMEKGFVVTLKKKHYEFQARNNPSATLKLHHPLKPVESFIILPSGKQINKDLQLTKIRKALRIEAIKLLSAKSGKKFGDDDDDNNMVIIPDEDSDTIRTDVELVEAVFDADPNMKSRYWYSGKTIYHCKPDTNLWYKFSEKVFDYHLRKHLKTTLQLTKSELRYIGMSNAITRLRNLTLGEIENIDFPDLLDSNLHLFITKNKTIVTSSIPPIVRNIERDDLAETTCGWSYNYELSMKHMQSVQSYFDKLIPRRCEREWFLSFVAKILNGQRMNDFFLVLTGKCENKNGISTLMSLLATVFGNYYIANTKIVVAGGSRDNNQYDGGIYNLKGKRLLVAHKLQNTDTLNCAFIKAITGQSNYYIQDKKKFSRTQFKFPVQAGLIMTFAEDNVPKFDKNDQDFVKRMAVISMRSQFLSKQEIDKLTQMGENMTDIHIADDSLKHHFSEWSSALLDLLIKYYKESLPPILDSMADWKKRLCNENYDYYDWLDSHVYRDDNNRNDAFITATEIMSIIHKSQEYFNPYEMKKLKLAMSQWANKNDFSYKARHVYMGSKKKRVEAKSVIMNAGLHNTNEECR